MTDGRRRPSSAVLLRFLLLVGLLAGGALLFRYTDLASLLDRKAVAEIILRLRSLWWAPVALVSLHLLVSAVGLPISPVILAGGAAFGVIWGWLYNFLGTLLGAGLAYSIARGLGHQFVAHLAGERRLRRIEALLQRHGFWTIVRSRFLIPFALVNFGAALVGVRFTTFLGATALGLAPSLLIYSYFGYALFAVSTQEMEVVLRNLTLTLVLVVLLTLVLPARAAWKRRRYRTPAADEGGGPAGPDGGE